RVVLLDEPTSALAGGEVARLRRVIRGIAEQGRTVLIVSQRLDDVFGVCDHVMVLRNGLFVESAPVAEFSSGRAIALMMHGHEGTSSQAKAAATTTGSREPAGSVADDVTTAALSTIGLVVHGQTAPVSLRLDRGEIVGLAGLPGSGTSEFLRALFGLRPASARDVRLFGDSYLPGRPADAIARGIAYVTGDRQGEGLVPDSSVADNITMVRTRTGRGGPRLLAAARRAALAQISALQIRPGDPDQPARALSGGNQQKVVFARWMLANPRLWLLDDATRGVDIGARREIHSAVRALTREGRAAALMVSSDLFELFEVCDRIVVFRGGAVIADIPSAETTPEAVEALTAGTVREPL
ncbi:MAG: ATP-binding cassette domain-containing protein, partial [Trebonia sp.]